MDKFFTYSKLFRAWRFSKREGKILLYLIMPTILISMMWFTVHYFDRRSNDSKIYFEYNKNNIKLNYVKFQIYILEDEDKKILLSESETLQNINGRFNKRICIDDIKWKNSEFKWKNMPSICNIVALCAYEEVGGDDVVYSGTIGSFFGIDLYNLFLYSDEKTIHEFKESKSLGECIGLPKNPVLDYKSLGGLESQFCGVLAGFALTVSVMLLERRGKNSIQGKSRDAYLYRAAIGIFVLSCGMATLAGALSLLTGSGKGLSISVLLIQSCISFNFAFSTILLFFGVYICLLAANQYVEYRIAHTVYFVAWFVGIIFGGYLISISNAYVVPVKDSKSIFHCVYTLITVVILGMVRYSYFSGKHKSRSDMSIDRHANDGSRDAIMLGVSSRIILEICMTCENIYRDEYKNKIRDFQSDFHVMWNEWVAGIKVTNEIGNWYVPKNGMIIIYLICTIVIIFIFSVLLSSIGIFKFRDSLVWIMNGVCIHVLLWLYFKIRTAFSGKGIDDEFTRLSEFRSYSKIFLNEMRIGLTFIATLCFVVSGIAFYCWVIRDQIFKDDTELVVHLIYYITICFSLAINAVSGNLLPWAFYRNICIEHIMFYNDNDYNIVFWRNDDAELQDEFFVFMEKQKVKIDDIKKKSISRLNRNKNNVLMTFDEYMNYYRRILDHPDYWEIQSHIVIDSEEDYIVPTVESVEVNNGILHGRIDHWDFCVVKKRIRYGNNVDKNSTGVFMICMYDDESKEFLKGSVFNVDKDTHLEIE